jgi:hypothetical protein
MASRLARQEPKRQVTRLSAAFDQIQEVREEFALLTRAISMDSRRVGKSRSDGLARALKELGSVIGELLHEGGAS